MNRSGCFKTILAIAAVAAAAPAVALDYQINGFASQGLVLSRGNNFFGQSTKGSLRYYEAGLSGTASLLPNLTAAAGVYMRDAGATDTGRPALDFALLDYRVLNGETGTLGLRAGRIKNPIGFYNDTRDSVFTRPSILLPLSIYADNQGEKRLFFSSDGGQLYGSKSFAGHTLSVSGTATRDRELGNTTTSLLVNLGGIPFTMQLKDFWNVQLLDETDDGRWRFGLSRVAGHLNLETTPDVGIAGNLSFGSEIASINYNAADLSLTAEYVLNSNRVSVTAAQAQLAGYSQLGDGGYLQAEYRIGPRWSLLARADSQFLNRHDRSGREAAAQQPGLDPNSRFAYDLTVGGHWRSRKHWGVWAEYHWIDGSASAQPLDNPGAVLADHWSIFLLMLGYRL
jgi:hypothetical protein